MKRFQPSQRVGVLSHVSFLIVIWLVMERMTEPDNLYRQQGRRVGFQLAAEFEHLE